MAFTEQETVRRAQAEVSLRKRVLWWSLFTGGVIVALLAVVAVGIFTFRGIGRFQDRADAKNRVKISQIEIRNQSQRIEVAQQKAEIRRVNAVGVREAQDEIAKTLTPLYVQFEMVDALKAIAKSGRNHSVVYLPSGANGIPLVSTIDPQTVGQPDDR